MKRRVAQKMRDHCEQMAAHCKETMGGRSEATGHQARTEKMREHCEEMAARHREQAEAVVAA